MKPGVADILHSSGGTRSHRGPENPLLADPDGFSIARPEAITHEGIPQQSRSDDHRKQWPECNGHLEQTLHDPLMIKRSRQHDKVPHPKPFPRSRPAKLAQLRCDFIQRPAKNKESWPGEN